MLHVTNMDKLKINLIPPEIKEKAKKAAKSAVIFRLSVGLLGVLILITVGILMIIIYQGVTVQALNSDIEAEKQALTPLKDKEAVVYFLKNRIDSINKFVVTQNTQNELFEIITGLLPPGVSLLALQINKSSQVVLQGETNSSVSLNNFFNNLTDPQTHDGKIASVTVESLNKSQTGVIRFSLMLNLAKSSME